MRNWVESLAEKINGRDKDYIDNTPRKFVTVPQPEQVIEIHVHKHVHLKKCLDRDMGTVVDLGPCNPCNSIRCEHIAQGISVRRRFVLSYIYIYPLRSRSRSYLHYMSPCC